MNDKNLRKNLVEVLTKAAAHVTVKQAVNGLKPENRNKRVQKEIPSIWEEFEHMRIAQEDILRYTLDSNYKSPKWPDEYWPDNKNLSDEKWNNSVKNFFSDLDEVTALVNNPKIDLTSEIPHGEGRTYLREILLIIDHNAYHLGKILQLRKMLGDWESGK